MLSLLVSVWMSLTAPSAGEVPQSTITVRVYPTAGLPPAIQRRALAEAKAVLHAALVDVEWRTCSRPDRHPACDAPPEPSELMVRMIRLRAARQDLSQTLGDAHVNRRSGGGVLATVYVNRVRGLANETGADLAVLLGRVTAHEVGHLLMRTDVHPPLGLMRASWTRDEVRRNRAADWTFTAADVAAIQQPGQRP